MNLKLALATIGVSILGVTSAFAQGVPGLSIVIDPQNESTPGILDYNANFTYTGAGSIFVVPNGLASFAPSAGYTEDATGLLLGLYPLQLGDLGGGIVTGTINEIVFALNYDGTAQNATGEYGFNIYSADPFDPNTPAPTLVTAPFAARVPGAAVPEPGTVALLVGMGVAGVAIRRRRK